MSCRRAFEVDLAAFLVDPRAVEWDDFRAHYPTCRECSAEVAAWTALDASLRPEHPTPEELLRWQDARDSLPPSESARIERHVAGCAACADELRALGGFGREALRDAAAADHARTASTDRWRRSPRPRSRVRDGGRRSRLGVARVLWHPAVPYAALLALLLLPTFRDRLLPPDGAPRESAPVEAGPAAAPASAPAKPAVQSRAAPAAETAADEPPSRLADRAEVARAESEARSAAPVARAPESARDAGARGDVAALGAPAGAAARFRTESDRDAYDAVAPARRASAILSAAGADGARELSIALPAALRAGTREVEVRVRDASGARELRERVPIAPGASAVAVRLPAGWLGAGGYRVELFADGLGLVSSSVVDGG